MRSRSLSFLSISTAQEARRTSNRENDVFKRNAKCLIQQEQVEKWYMESRRRKEKKESNIVHKHRWWWRRRIWAVALENWAFNVTTAENLKKHSFRFYLIFCLLSFSLSRCHRLVFCTFCLSFFFISCISHPIPNRMWASEKLFFIRFNYLQRGFLFFFFFSSFHPQNTASFFKELFFT